MSTLTEIETAVSRLPVAEQEKLLRHLETALRGKRNAGAESREDWMRRLDVLRSSLASGISIQSSEHILEDLRGD